LSFPRKRESILSSHPELVSPSQTRFQDLDPGFYSLRLKDYSKSGMTKKHMISPVKIWRRQKDIGKLLGKKGKIITWTMIYVAGSEFKKFAPYPVAVIQLEEGKKITAPIVDYEKGDLRIGSEVKVILRKVREGDKEDVLVYGVKLKPI